MALTENINAKAVIEAILFTASEPVSIEKFHEVLPEMEIKSIKSALQELKKEYEDMKKPYSLEELAGGYVILTRKEFYGHISRLSKSRDERKLSPAALEVLAIIAYKQPVRRVDIESIRGVDSKQLISLLMEKGIVRIAGRSNEPGSPLLYATTKRFLDMFGLNSLLELPRPEEIK
jgi:segregation and condensation protein B